MHKKGLINKKMFCEEDFTKHTFSQMDNNILMQTYIGIDMVNRLKHMNETEGDVWK